MKLFKKLVKIKEFYIIKFAQISDFQGVPGGRFKNKLEVQKIFWGLMYPPVMGKHRELLQNPILSFSGTPYCIVLPRWQDEYTEETDRSNKCCSYDQTNSLIEFRIFLLLLRSASVSCSRSLVRTRDSLCVPVRNKKFE